MTATTSAIDAPAPARPQQQRRRSPAMALALLFAVAVGPFVADYSAQPAARYALTAGIVEQGTVVLDDYEDVIGFDRIERNGHLYSDKAPGQPLLAVPFFALAKAVGAEPATHLRVEGNLGVWWVTLWSAVVPGALLAFVMHKRLERLGMANATLAVGVWMGSTMLLPFSGLLFGHVLAALATYAAWCLLAPNPGNVRKAAMAGALCGFAVLVEYPLVVTVLVLGGFVLWRRQWASLVAFAAAGIPAAVVLAGYQYIAFGSPVEDSYGQKAGTSPVITGMPDAEMLGRILFAERGLFLVTPIVAAAVVGLVLCCRRGADPDPPATTDGPAVRTEAVLGLVLLGAYLLLASGWGNPWGGEGPGPRYLLPALPFLVVGVARALSARRTLVLALAAVSALSMAAPIITDHLVPHGATILGQAIRTMRAGEWTPTVFTLAVGPAGWVFHAALVVLAAVGLRNALRSERAGHTADPAPS